MSLWTDAELREVASGLREGSLFRIAVQKFCEERAHNAMKSGRDAMLRAVPDERQALRNAIESDVWQGLLKVLDSAIERES